MVAAWRKGRLKHGCDMHRRDLDGIDVTCAVPSDDILALDEALARLEQEDPQGAKLVQLRYFAGLTHEEPGLAYRCRWTAAGSVGHWGHVHRRTNLYDASITIQPVDGIWKITAIDLREEQRVDPTLAR